MLVVFQLAQYCSLCLINNQLETGWWYTYPSEKYDFVSWDDDYSQCDGKVIKFMFQTTNQNRFSEDFNFH